MKLANSLSRSSTERVKAGLWELSKETGTKPYPSPYPFEMASIACCPLPSPAASSLHARHGGRISGHGATRPCSSVSASREQCLIGKSLKLTPQRSFSIASKAASSTPKPVAGSSEFADKEASKFRQDLLQELEKEQSIADVKGRIADTCTKVFRSFVETYSGTISPQPFENMKVALEQQGLPSDKALRAAIWWARVHLYHDWNQWTSVK